MFAPRAALRLASAPIPNRCLAPSPSSSSFAIVRRAFHFLPRDPFGPSVAAAAAKASPPTGSMVASRLKTQSRGSWGGAGWSQKVAAVGIGAGVAWLGYQTVSADGGPGRIGRASCDSLPIPSTPPPDLSASSTNPTSMLSVYELSFGAVCGICTGVFVKKGARALAFLLGGVFVLMQYLSSKSIINVNWSKLSSKYDTAFGSTATPGQASRAPTIGGLFQWFSDFVTANFQQRASFLAGVALGLRLG